MESTTNRGRLFSSTSCSSRGGVFSMASCSRGGVFWQGRVVILLLFTSALVGAEPQGAGGLNLYLHFSFPIFLPKQQDRLFTEVPRGSISSAIPKLSITATPKTSVQMASCFTRTFLKSRKPSQCLLRLFHNLMNPQFWYGGGFPYLCV